MCLPHSHPSTADHIPLHSSPMNASVGAEFTLSSNKARGAALITSHKVDNVDAKPTLAFQHEHNNNNKMKKTK